MLILSLYFGLANAAAVVFTNSSSSSSPDATITAPPSTTSIGPPPCLTWDLNRNCFRSGEPFYSSYMSFNNPYYDYNYMERMMYISSETSLLDYCITLWDNSFDQWQSTAAVTSMSLIPATTSTNSLYSDEVSTFASWWSVSYQSGFPYTASAPCCAVCTLYGGNVQVYYWPFATQSPPVSKLVNDVGFTFVSPSVYVAFESLYATDFCGTVGTLITATTLSFPPDALSTDTAWHYDNVKYSTPALFPEWKTADWASIKNCSDITVSFWQWEDYDGTALTVYEDYANNTMYTWYTATYNPCSPTMSVPTELFTINPGWTSCVPGIDGLYDPPYVLTAGNGLAAFATTTSTPVKDPAAQTTSFPVAGQTITPPIVGPTATPTAPIAPINTPAASSTENDPPAETPKSNNKVPSSTPNDSPVSSSNTDSPVASPTTNDPPANLQSTFDPAPSSSAASDDPSSPPKETQPIDSADARSSISVDPAALLTTNSHSNIIIASQTLTPGGQLTYSGATYSLATNAATLAVADSSGTLTHTALSHQTSPVLDPNYVIGTQTLSPGGTPIIISGTSISLFADGSSVVVAGSNQALSALLTETTSTDGMFAYIVEGKTLVAGASAIAVSGEFVSLDPDGKSVVIDGPSGRTTEPLSQFLGPSTTIAETSQGLGGVIASLGGFVEEPATDTGHGGSEATATAMDGSSHNVTEFLGRGTNLRASSHWMSGLLVGIYALYICSM